MSFIKKILGVYPQSSASIDLFESQPKFVKNASLAENWKGKSCF
jgi:hypothetical protein